MKKISTLLVFSLLLLTAFAKTVTIGYYAAPGMMNGAKDGVKKSGYAYEYIMEMAKYADWQFRYVYGSFGELYEKLKRGEIDMLPYVTKTEEREREVLFPRMAMGEERIFLGVKNPGNLSERHEELNGKKIGIIKGAFFNQLVKEHFEGIDVIFVEYGLASEKLAALEKGEIDYIIELSTAAIDSSIYPIHEFDTRHPFHLAVARTKPDLLKELDAAHEYTEKMNPAFLHGLSRKYFFGGANSEITLGRLLMQHPEYGYAAVAILLLAGLVIVVLVSMARLRRIKIETEERELKAALATMERDHNYDMLLHNAIGASRWTYEISANGEVTAAKYGYLIADYLGAKTGPMNWLELLHPEDRERVEANFMAAVRDPEGKISYESSFRMHNAKGAWCWVKSSGRVVKHDDGSRELVGLSVDITDTVEAQQKRVFDEAEARRLRAREQELMHAEFRASAVAYVTDHEGDVKSFLNFFADRLRKLINCDQVIYQGADGQDIINSAPEFGDFQLDPKVCSKCPHQDYRSPVYAKGVTEIEDHRQGFEGVPVAEGCPVKSSLTRIIHLEGKPSGYLAIHYINDYHKFTEHERRTLEEFSNLLSISLSRFEVREKNAALQRELELKRKIEEQQKKLEALLVDAEQAIQRNMVLRRITKSAAWSVRFNAKHEIVQTEYSNELRDVIGNDFNDNEGWIGLIHPDDRERAIRESLSALRDKSGETQFDSEYRVLRRDNAYHWIRSAGRIILDSADGGEMYGICVDIDESIRRREERQRELETALQEIREIRNRGEMVVDALHSAQWRFSLSADDRIVGWDYSRDIAKIVKNAKAAQSYEWTALLHPDDREPTNQAFYATLKDHSGKTPYDVTFRMIDDRGKYNWFRSVGNAFRREDGTGEFYGIHIDITERIEREQAAEERNRMFSEVAKTIYGYNTTVELDSGAMSVIVGRGAKAAQEALCSAGNYLEAIDLMFARIKPVHHAELRQLLSLESLRRNQHERGVFGTAVYETLDGFWGEVTLIFGIGVNGKPIANILGRDITEQRREAARIKKLEQAAAQAKIDAAEETSRAKTMFLANMSHDIRTPMNAIIGFSDIAQKHVHDPEKLGGYLEKVKIAGSHLLDVINDILDMSKIDSNTVEITEYPAYISRMPLYFHTICDGRAKAHNHTFTCEMGEIRDDAVWADKPHLNRIVINLLTNAIKYTPDGGRIAFRVEQLPDPVEHAGEYARFRITVEDNGMGMSEEYQQHIFERFTREKNSTVSGIQGTGIGMAIAKSLTDAMGGTIEVASKEGEGTKFTLTFDFRKRKPGEGEMAEEDLNRSIEIADYEGQVKRLLLVEDNEINREIALEILQGQNFELDTAVNGKEAVEKVKSTAYDIVLMDIMMPVMSGLEASKAIRAAGINVPIIALSANAFSEDREASLAAGMNDHLSKPIKAKELMEAISKFT